MYLKKLIVAKMASIVAILATTISFNMCSCSNNSKEGLSHYANDNCTDWKEIEPQHATDVFVRYCSDEKQLVYLDLSRSKKYNYYQCCNPPEHHN